MINAIIAAVLLGISKAGLKGPGVAIVGLVALDFGSKPSTGILLPLLILADILAVSYYRRNVNKELLFKFLPVMFIGVIVGAAIGEDVPAAQFKFWMAVIIVLGLVIMIVRDIYWKNSTPKGQLFSSVMGFSAGFTTMVGNLAGPFANLYFLAHNTKKDEFIGTAAVLFFVINIFKIPFHFFWWETINLNTLWIDLQLAIPVIIGFFIGLKVVKLISDKWYIYVIYLSTAIGTLLILFS